MMSFIITLKVKKKVNPIILQIHVHIFLKEKINFLLMMMIKYSKMKITYAELFRDDNFIKGAA